MRDNNAPTFSALNKFTTKNMLILVSALLLAIAFGVVFLTNAKLGVVIFLVLLFIGPIIFFPLTFFLIFLATLPLEGFAAFENFSFTKIFGLVVVLSLSLKILISREFIHLNDRFYVFFYLFILSGLVSSLFAKDITLSLSILSTYLFLAVLYFITCYFITNINVLDLIVVLLIGYTIGVSMLVQAMNVSIRGLDTWRISSGFGDPNEFALFLLILLPMGFYKILWSQKSKALFIAAFGILLILLLLTGSRGGIIAFVGLMAVLAFYFSRQRWQYLLVFPILVALLLTFLAPEGFWDRLFSLNYLDPENDFSSELRLGFYQAAIQMFLDHPLIGVGLHNFRLFALEYGASRAMVVHNTYLEILSGGGLFSFIPFVLILGLAWTRLSVQHYSNPRLRDLAACLKASLFAFMIGAMFITADHKKFLWLLLALVSAVYYLSRAHGEQEEHSSFTFSRIGAFDYRNQLN